MIGFGAALALALVADLATGFAVPLPATGFAVPLPATGFAVPLPATGFAVPLRATGLATSVTLPLVVLAGATFDGVDLPAALPTTGALDLDDALLLMFTAVVVFRCEEFGAVLPLVFPAGLFWIELWVADF